MCGEQNFSDQRREDMTFREFLLAFRSASERMRSTSIEIEISRDSGTGAQAVEDETGGKRGGDAATANPDTLPEEEHQNRCKGQHGDDLRTSPGRTCRAQYVVGRRIGGGSGEVQGRAGESWVGVGSLRAGGVSLPYCKDWHIVQVCILDSTHAV